MMIGMSSDLVQVVHDDARGAFLARLDGAEAGYLTHVREGDAVRLTHTVVDPAFEGRGVGSALVVAALDAAEQQGVGVLPQCTFVRAWLGRHPERLGLVPAGRRAEFGLPEA